MVSNLLKRWRDDFATVEGRGDGFRAFRKETVCHPASSRPTSSTACYTWHVGSWLYYRLEVIGRHHADRYGYSTYPVLLSAGLYILTMGTVHTQYPSRLDSTYWLTFFLRLASRFIITRNKVYKSTISSVALYRCENQRLFHQGCLRTKYRVKYLDLWESWWQETGENCIMKGFIICSTHNFYSSLKYF
jgi:hypothetical protein